MFYNVRSVAGRVLTAGRVFASSSNSNVPADD